MGNSTVRLSCYKDKHITSSQVKMSLLSSVHHDARILRLLHDIIWRFIYVLLLQVLMFKILT